MPIMNWTPGQGRAGFLRVGSVQDLVAGSMFIAVGAFGLWLSSGYSMGTAMRIGTGVLTMLLCGGLVGVGAIIAVRSFTFEGERLTSFAVWPLLLVMAAVLVFSYRIEWAGLFFTTIATSLVASLVGREDRPEEAQTGRAQVGTP